MHLARVPEAHGLQLGLLLVQPEPFSAWPTKPFIVPPLMSAAALL